MIKKISLLIFLFCYSLIYTQNISVSGKIIDQNTTPISYANVLLLSVKDSTLIKGTTTDDNGNFHFENVVPDNYIVKISFIGFVTKESSFDLVKDTELQPITLEEDIESLDEVELFVKKPTLKREADRLVFNVESTSLSEGNMMDVLRSTPGVLVLDNSIEVKNTEPTVYINDRKVHLSSSELTELLEGTSASNIKSIEVITNPPARYDADSGVVLNLVMAKNLITGYRGSLFSNYTQGVFPKTNYGITNFFKGSIVSAFVNYSYNNKKIDRVNNESVAYSDQLWNTINNRNTWSETHNISFNIDFEFDKNNTLSIASNIQLLPYFKYLTLGETQIADLTGTPTQKFNSVNLSRDNKHNLGFDLDYRHSFKNNSKLLLNAHYTAYDYERDQRVNSDYFLSDESFINNTAFKTFANQDTEIITSQMDYTLPLKESASFDAGIKFSNIKTNSGIIHKNIINGEEELDLNNTNKFDYKEEIYGAYVSFEKQFNKWEFSGGVRAEQTKIESKSDSETNQQTQDYLRWFPTASLSYNASDNISIYSNYKRSIQRPDYSSLNPFKFFLNDNTIVTGNPSLKPVFIDLAVLGISFKQRYTFEAYYKTSKNNIFELPIQNEDETTNEVTLTFTPLNINSSKEFGFDFITFFDMTKKWSIYFVTSFYNTKDEASFSGSVLKRDRWSNYSIFSNDVLFLKDNSLTANFTLTYVSSNIQGLQEVDTRVLTELSIKKTMFKKKGVLSLSISDLFNDHDFSVTTQFNTQNSRVFSNLDNRYIKVGFRYNFGNIKLSTNERTPSVDERDRLNKSDY